MSNYRRAMVELIEKTYGMGQGRGQLENLVQCIEEARHLDHVSVVRKGNDVTANPAVAPLVADPGSFTSVLGFVASEVIYLAQAAQPVLEGVASRPVATNEAARLIKKMNGALKNMVQLMMKRQPWAIQNGPIEVIRVWRDRRDEMTGKPEKRNLPQDQIPRNHGTYVLVQGDTGATHPYLCVTDNNYRLDEQDGKEYRADFLIDINQYVELCLDKRETGFTRDVKPAYKMGLLINEFLEEFIEFTEATGMMNSFLKSEGIEADSDGLYDDAVSAVEAGLTRTVSADDNPDAKYNIGEFA